MKKLISLLLVLAMLVACPLTLASCGEPDDNGGTGTTDNNENPGNNNNNDNNNQNKITGNIFAASLFSEGLAFVQTDADETPKTHCIDTNGNIIFTMNTDIPKTLGEINAYFISGLACVISQEENYVVDKTGKITRPADVGATHFYPVALKEGYLVVTREEVTYSGSKKELGLMTTNFEWVAEPTEDLYSSVYQTYFGAINYEDYSACREGYLYVERNGSDPIYIKLETCEISTECPDIFAFKYNQSDASYAIREKYGDTVNLVLVDYDSLTAVVTFRNEGKVFVTVVDQEMNMKFEPVLVVENSYSFSVFSRNYYDGEYILLSVRDSSSKEMLVILDKDGNKLGSMYPTSLGENVAYSYEFMDGIVRIIGRYNGYIRSLGYYKTDFTPLF